MTRSSLDNPADLSLESIAHHEAGHTLVALILGDEVRGASVTRVGLVGGRVFHGIPFVDFMELPGRSKTYGCLLRLLVFLSGKPAQLEYERRNGLTSDIDSHCESDMENAEREARELLTSLQLAPDPFRFVRETAAFELSQITGCGADRRVNDLIEALDVESKKFISRNIDDALIERALTAASELASEIVLANWKDVTKIAEALIAWRRLTDGILPHAREKVEQRFAALGGVPQWLTFQTENDTDGNCNNNETH